LVLQLGKVYSVTEKITKTYNFGSRLLFVKLIIWLVK